MAFTLSHALQQLPILSSARVAAGRNRLDHPVRWTHIVDQPEVFSWVREGDLLVTTAYALKDNLDSELGMVEQMSRKGIAGMLVSIGRYINAVPDTMLAAAEACDFPIVVIPWEIPLVEVTHAIHERIIREQYQVTEQLYHIHDVLSQLVLEGGGLPQLAERLSGLLACSVAIEDDAFHLQAHASGGVMDDARRRTIDSQATPPEIRRYLAEAGILEKIKSDPRPQRVPILPGLGLTLERMIAPILVGQDLYGYIWIIAGSRPFDQLDMQAVERAAHLAALILSREQSVLAAEQRLKTRMFENLMDPSGAQNPYALQEILHQFGLYGNCAVVLVEQENAGISSRTSLLRIAEQIITEQNLSGAVVEWGGRFLWLVGAPPDQTPEALGEMAARKLLERWGARGGKLFAGISVPPGGPAGLRAAYYQALQALQIGLLLDKGQPGVWLYDRLGYLPWLRSVPADLRAGVSARRLAEQIARHDAENATAFLPTLESYLNNQRNHSRTARELFIHRNSLLKRLDRMQELWAIDFEDALSMLNLHLAVIDFRLGQGDQ